jgi:hypothetical protein
MVATRKRKRAHLSKRFHGLTGNSDGPSIVPQIVVTQLLQDPDLQDQVSTVYDACSSRNDEALIGHLANEMLANSYIQPTPAVQRHLLMLVQVRSCLLL